MKYITTIPFDKPSKIESLKFSILFRNETMALRFEEPMFRRFLIDTISDEQPEEILFTKEPFIVKSVDPKTLATIYITINDLILAQGDVQQ